MTVRTREVSEMSASDYADDARRIERDYVDPESTSIEEIREDLEDADFAAAAIPDIEDWIPSRGDIRVPSDPDEAHEGGVLTREKVEKAVVQADDIGYSEERRDALTDGVSREIGAPSEENLRASQVQQVTESVAPADVVEGDERTTPVSIVRNTEGEVVGTVGASGPGEAVAEEVGGEHLGDLNEFRSRQRSQPAPDGRRAALTVETPSGRREIVGEVDL